MKTQRKVQEAQEAGACHFAEVTRRFTPSRLLQMSELCPDCE